MTSVGLGRGRLVWALPAALSLVAGSSACGRSTTGPTATQSHAPSSSPFAVTLPDLPNSIAVAARKGKLIVVTHTKGMYRIDIESGKIDRRAPSVVEGPLALDESNARIYAPVEDGVGVFSLDTLKLIRTVPFKMLGALAIDDRRQILVMTNQGEGVRPELTFVNRLTGRELAVKSPSLVVALATDTERGSLYAAMPFQGSPDDWIQVRDVETGKVLRSFSRPAGVDGANVVALLLHSQTEQVFALVEDLDNDIAAVVAMTEDGSHVDTLPIDGAWLFAEPGFIFDAGLNRAYLIAGDDRPRLLRLNPQIGQIDRSNPLEAQAQSFAIDPVRQMAYILQVDEQIVTVPL